MKQPGGLSNADRIAYCQRLLSACETRDKAIKALGLRTTNGREVQPWDRLYDGSLPVESDAPDIDPPCDRATGDATAAHAACGEDEQANEQGTEEGAP